MSATTRDELLRRLFRQAADNQTVPSGPHVADDEELLACWADDLLSAPERDRLVEHLSQCPPCRRQVAEMLRAGVIHFTESPAATGGYQQPEPEPVVLRPSRWWQAPAARWAGLAAAASLLVAVMLTQQGNSPHQAMLAQAQTRFNDGQYGEALDELETLLQQNLTDDERQRGLHLLEQAGFAHAHRRLTQGQFEQVDDIGQRLRKLGVNSVNMTNLELQAAESISSQWSLEQQGGLTLLGYDVATPTQREVTRDVPGPEVEESDQRWQAALREHPGEAQLHLNYGYLLLKQDRFDEAKAQFEAAADDEEHRHLALLGLGLIEYLEGNYQAALDQFRAAETIEPESADLQLNLAMTLEALGQHEAAVVHWQRAAELTSDPELRQQIETRL